MRPQEAVPLSDRRRLRYALTLVLLHSERELTVPELEAAALANGCTLDVRPAKAVSDALRTEVTKGRVVRVGWGRYRPGTVPRSTQWWLRACLAEDDRLRSTRGSG